MEWMLQVVDEVDDAIGAVKHRWLGLRIELGLKRFGSGSVSVTAGAALAVGFGITMAAVVATFAMGAGAAS